MAKPPRLDEFVMPKGGAGGQSPVDALSSEDTREAAVQAVQNVTLQDNEHQSQPQEARPERVTFVTLPSTKVATANVQTRIPVHIARNLRILSALLDVSQQAMMEKWITDGVTELWRQSQGGKPS